MSTSDWLTRTYPDPARRNAVLAAYRAQIVPEGENGRLIVGDLIRYCGLARSSFVPGQPDQTAFNEGARDVLLHVLGMLGLAMDQILPLLTEGRTDG